MITPASSPLLQVAPVAKIAPVRVDLMDAEQEGDTLRLLASVFADGALHSYAILDGACLTNLPDWLETSGLDYMPLLQGDAQDALAEVAPYLVRLDRGAKAARGLFTRSDAAWHMWDADGCVVIHSEVGLAELRQHLRRLIRLRDPRGEWLFFRYWSPTTLHGLRGVLGTSAPHLKAMFGKVVARILYKLPGQDRMMSLTPVLREEGRADGFVLDGPTRHAMQRFVPQAQVFGLQRAAEARLAKHDPSTFEIATSLPASVRFGHTKRILRLGLDDPHLAATLLAIIYSTGIDILREPAFDYATANPFLGPNAKARQLIMGYQMVAALKET